MGLELEFDTRGEEVSINGRRSRGECLPAHALPPEQGLDALPSFSNDVGRAVRGGKACAAGSSLRGWRALDALIPGEGR